MSILPSALINTLSRIPHFDVEAFKQVHDFPEQITSIRLNPLKYQASAIAGLPVLQTETLQFDAVRWSSNGFYLSRRPSFIADPYLHAGVYYVQEASSMFLEQALKAVAADRSGLKVLDLCAAPGGKSTLIQSYIHKDSLLVSNEVIKSRAAILEENLTKWGAGNVVVTNNDAEDFAAMRGYFDIIVADAPCSGSGLFRKDAAAIEEWSEQHVQLCAQRQKRILAGACEALTEEGYLIYSTCSFSAEENEEIADWLIDQFEMEPVPVMIQPEWNITATYSRVHEAPGYRFYPHLLKGEGFFMAVFRKKEGRSGNIKRSGKKLFLRAGKQEYAVLQEWVKADGFQMYKQQDRFFAFPAVLEQDLLMLTEYLYLRKAGVALGKIKGSSLIPEHELALSTIYHPQIPSAEVDLQQAVQYLRKQDLVMPGLETGWHLMKYEGISLGWIKSLSNRINNYYPANWRILKTI